MRWSGGSGGGGGGGGGGSGLPAAPSVPGFLQSGPGVPAYWAPVTGDQVGPAFVPSLSGGASVDVGTVLTHATLTKGFSGGTPTAATLLAAALAGGAAGDAAGTSSANVLALANAFPDPGTFTLAGRGSSVTRILQAVANGVTKNVSTAWSAYQRTRYGTGPAGMGLLDVNGVATGRTAAQVAAFALGLGASLFASSRVGTFGPVTAATGDKLYHWLVNAFGVPTFMVGGFAGGFVRVATAVSFTVNGIADTGDLWESVQPSLVNKTWVTT
jgi:hypothetical protein